jgi:putative membrane protein
MRREMRNSAAALLIAITFPAHAHETGTTHVSGSAYDWTYDPWVVGPLLCSGVLYFIGTQRLWRRAGLGRGVHQWQAACFWTGWACLALALVSPLHWLGERLFVAHMIEHTLIMAVAAPLIAVSRPLGAILWALPRSVRGRLGALSKFGLISVVWRRAREPLTATAVAALALWMWHIPAFYGLALTQPLAHRLQHICFLLSASLFWWSLLSRPARTHGYGTAIFCLFVTAMQSGVLGTLLTVSRRLWFPAQGALASEWGMTTLEDQQLAGLVMWVPMGFIYTAAALIFAARWIGTSSEPHLLARRDVALAP